MIDNIFTKRTGLPRNKNELSFSKVASNIKVLNNAIYILKANSQQNPTIVLLTKVTRHTLRAEFMI